MKATIITSSLAALSLAGMLTLPALADSGTTTAAGVASPTSTAARPHRDRGGCPDGFDAGDSAGVRICHGAEGWRIVTTDPAKSGPHEYTGTITTDGKFADVYLVRPESDDSASVDGNGNLVYDFKTFSGVDGVDFRVDGGKKITLNLSVDGQPMPVQEIFVGDKGRHPQADPFTLRAHPRHHRKATQPSPLASPAVAPAQS